MACRKDPDDSKAYRTEMQGKEKARDRSHTDASQHDPADFKLPPFGFSILRVERFDKAYAPELDD